MIETYEQLRKEMSLAIQDALAECMEKLLEELRENIENMVYGKSAISNGNFGNNNYNKGYQRTYDFLNMWKVSKPVIVSNLVLSILDGDWESMRLDVDNYIHGSHWEKTEDARPFLADIIFDGKAGDLFGNGYWREKRDAWSETLKVFSNGTFDSWFKTACKKRGLPLIDYTSIF